MGCVIEVLRSSNSTKTPTNPAAGNRSQNHNPNPNKREPEMLSNCRMWTTFPHTHPPQCESQLYIFEDSEAVIKMIIKGRSPTKRRVSRTHRVAHDWSFDRIHFWTPRSKSNIVDTKNQLAVMLTKASFTREKWDPSPFLNIMNFSMFSCSHFLSNRNSVPCRREPRKVLLKRVRQWRNRDRCQETS